MIMCLPLSFSSIGPVLRYIILSLYIIGSPEIVTKGYRSFFYLYGSLNLFIVFSDIWFLITLLLTNTLNVYFPYLAHKLKYYLINPLRV